AAVAPFGPLGILFTALACSRERHDLPAILAQMAGASRASATIEWNSPGRAAGFGRGSAGDRAGAEAGARSAGEDRGIGDAGPAACRTRVGAAQAMGNRGRR